ncbi:hypothetical protein [Thiomicrorhabdus sp. Kp2]|uniref:hypothetical protein n=1 Tax=Thiomicrorhabdus sp. Kp2 TaxID=1123518 RepID=UPI0012FED372|nr:hypothetical protein [Thiomicrorhabdus sp. Kp2]
MREDKALDDFFGRFYKFNSPVSYPLSSPVRNHAGFIEVLESRETHRRFDCIDLQRIGHLFYLSNRTLTVGLSELGHEVQHRPVISAGGLHSVEIVFWLPQHKSWFHYNPIENSAELISLNSESINQFIQESYQMVIDANSAALIWFVCDLSRLAVKYKSPLELAYRDSGAILATQSLVAEYLDLSYCPLGSLGGSQACEISNDRDFIGVGAALVGERK